MEKIITMFDSLVREEDIVKIWKQVKKKKKKTPLIILVQLAIALFDWFSSIIS
jgi:hypothetical protein